MAQLREWFRSILPRREYLSATLPLFLIFMACVPSYALQTSTESTPLSTIKIGIIGDQTFSTNIQASYGVLAQGVGVLSGQNLDVVLHTGDLVESTLGP